MKYVHAAGLRRLAPWPVLAPGTVAVAAMVAGHFASSGVWWDLAWTAAVAAVAGTLLGRRAAADPNRGHWSLWAAATGCWLAGQVGWDVFGIVGVPSSPNLADLGWWAFALVMLVSLVRMRTRSRALLIVGAAEILPVIAAAAALTYALLWRDAGASMLPIAAVPARGGEQLGRVGGADAPGAHARGALWLPAGTYDWDDTSAVWTPAAAAAPGPDGWHPEDMLMLPMGGAAGEAVGMVSLDQPLHGRRPDDAEIALLMAVANQAGLAVKQAHRAVEGGDALKRQSAELRLAAVMLLAETLDLRDAGTARHSRTVGAYARHTAVALGLSPDRVERVHAAGVLHDLGKLGIADAILHKRGALDEAEWNEIVRHPEIGARILEHAGMRDIAGWVRAHHERVDGRGYPEGIGGEEIPLEARILAVADAYEAMTADRPYRAGMPAASACTEIIRCAGTQFDPTVVEAFLASLDARDEKLGPAPFVDGDGSAFVFATIE